MSVSQVRSQLERKRKQRLDAEKKLGESRTKESSKFSEAVKLRQQADKAASESTRKSRLREAERKEKDAISAGKEASSWQRKLDTLRKEEDRLHTKLNKEENAEADALARQRQREQRQAAQKAERQQASISRRIESTEKSLREIASRIPSAKPEKLRVLLLGAASRGDLRVSREQSRIRAAVESALHRDQIEIDARPSATPDDLLDGLSKFRPHVVHFSGHGNSSLIQFEDDEDGLHDGVVVTARAFSSAIQATDYSPTLVVLNSCSSAPQAAKLVEEIVPFAIGMADSIDDADAIGYAARFYASVANGESIRSAHSLGKAALELAGLSGAELPTLCWAEDWDPWKAYLVKPI
ncbi:CHAT domain-containing protein [Corynebacterium sp. 20_84]